jgi:hypothetical protein
MVELPGLLVYCVRFNRQNVVDGFRLFKDGGPQENVVNNRGTLTKAKRNKAKQVNLTKAKRTKAKRTKEKHKVGST